MSHENRNHPPLPEPADPESIAHMKDAGERARKLVEYVREREALGAFSYTRFFDGEVVIVEIHSAASGADVNTLIQHLLKHLIANVGLEAAAHSLGMMVLEAVNELAEEAFKGVSEDDSEAWPEEIEDTVRGD